MKGLLFKPEMIKAIVKGRKTVTRRLLNPQPSDEETLEYGYFTPALEDKNGEQYPADYEIFGAYTSDGEYSWKPRYHPGDIVYIKEAWRIINAFIGTPHDFGIKYADGEVRWWTDNEGAMDYPIDESKNHSPMFLPEKFARYFLRIKDVRTERLQEITEADAVQEGVQLIATQYAEINYETMTVGEDQPETYRHAYSGLWDSINKKTPWESNPWVWRIEFELTEKVKT